MGVHTAESFASPNAPSGPAPDKNMVWIPGGSSPWARTTTIPKKRPRIRDGRRLLDRSLSGDQRPVPPIRQSHGLCNGRRAGADPASIPAQNRRCWCRVDRLQPTARPGAAEQPLQLVGLETRRRLATSGGTGEQSQRPGTASGAARCLGGYRGLCGMGRQSRYRPRRNGSSRLAAGRGLPFAWGHELAPKDACWPTTGKGNSPGRTWNSTDSSAPRRSDRSLRTATDSST